MKNTMICFALLFATQAFAGSPQETYNAKYASYTLNNLIQQKADGMGDGQLQYIEKLLNQLQSVVLNPVPFFPPTAPPVAPAAPRSNYAVNGTIQGNSYAFTVNSLNQLSDQCVSFVQSKGLNRIDSVEVSINFGAIQARTNVASYWTSSNDICSQVLQVARAAGVTVDSSLGRTAVGSIQGNDYKFVGDLATMSTQCGSFVASKGLNRIDNITISIDFGDVHTSTNSTEYWTTSFDICQQILQYAR